MTTGHSSKPKPAPGSLRELVQVALPLVISSGSVTLMYVVDRIFLTWHSPEALAAAMPASHDKEGAGAERTKEDEGKKGEWRGRRPAEARKKGGREEGTEAGRNLHEEGRGSGACKINARLVFRERGPFAVGQLLLSRVLSFAAPHPPPVVQS